MEIGAIEDAVWDRSIVVHFGCATGTGEFRGVIGMYIVGGIMAQRVKTVLTELEDRNLPAVALVGRPNVGKSTLFNRLTRSRRAIIDASPGMTRDRLYGTVSHGDHRFRLIDTGGIEEDPDRMIQLIRSQAEAAIWEAQVIVFLVDGRAGLLSGDRQIGIALRSLGKPVIVFANKLDQGEESRLDTEIYELGFARVVTGSAEHDEGMADLLDGIAEHLTDASHEKAAEKPSQSLRLAIIGRPNVGKSSLVNRLLGEERVLVSDIPGTTRDPVDTYLTYGEQDYCLVDTAGIRKSGRIKGSQEHLSVLMAKRQVARAHVIVMIIDASDPLAAQDATIAGIADQSFRPVILAVNKWDLISDKQTHTARDFESRIRRRMKFLEASPFVFVSAKTGQRVSRILDLARDIRRRACHRVPTALLNQFVVAMAKTSRLPTHKGKRLKILYMTQVEVDPPKFVCVVNTRMPLHFSQERYLINKISEAFSFQGIPVKLIVKPRARKE